MNLEYWVAVLIGAAAMLLYSRKKRLDGEPASVLSRFLIMTCISIAILLIEKLLIK